MFLIEVGRQIKRECLGIRKTKGKLSGKSARTASSEIRGKGNRNHYGVNRSSDTRQMGGRNSFG